MGPVAAAELWDGRWRIERELAQGTTGTVYLALDVAMNRPVAVKLLSPSLAEQPEHVARFAREASLMARLEQHPNVVTLLAHGQRGGVPFLVMEYLEGETLRERLARETGPTPPDLLLQWAAQIGAGLDFIHSKGLIHRDVKPSNLLVDRNERIAVLDLGTAIAVEGTRLTRAGSVIGTPAYLSPELAEAKPVDLRADVYSFGVVLFELATGRRPFEGEGMAELLRAHLEAEPPRASSVCAAVPFAVDEILARCLAKRPADRFATSGAVVEALDQAYRAHASRSADRLGKYRLLRKLAAGGTGEVFLASAEGPMGFEKTVVVKRILPHLANDPKVVERFVREARLAARVNHPNVAQIYDFGHEPGLCFIAMEYVDGPTLRSLTNHFARQGRAAPAEVWVRVVSQAAEGLAAVHSAGFIHRDLTPENLLISKSGVVKVVDFGLAKDLAQPTRSLSIRGKYGYIAPEQLQGGKLDARTDVFSLGVVLYELTTGHKPFDGPTQAEMLRAVLEAPLVPASRRNPAVPPSLDRVLARALDRKAAARFQNCEELHVALEEFLSVTGAVSSFELARMVADYGAGTSVQTSTEMPVAAPPAPPPERRAPPAAAPPLERHTAAAAPPGVPYGRRPTRDGPAEEAQVTAKLGELAADGQGAVTTAKVGELEGAPEAFGSTDPATPTTDPSDGGPPSFADRKRPSGARRAPASTGSSDDERALPARTRSGSAIPAAERSAPARTRSGSATPAAEDAAPAPASSGSAVSANAAAAERPIPGERKAPHPLLLLGGLGLLALGLGVASAAKDDIPEAAAHGGPPVRASSSGGNAGGGRSGGGAGGSAGSGSDTQRPAKERKGSKEALANQQRMQDPKRRGGKGELVISSTTPVEVRIDGVPLGTTPLPPLLVDEGQHRVTFIRGHRPVTRTLSVGAGDSVVVEP